MKTFFKIIKFLPFIPVAIIALMLMGVDIITLIFYSLMYAVPVLIGIVLIKFIFVAHRAYRDRKSLAAFKDDEAAVSMEKERIKARRIGALGMILWPVVFGAAMYMEANVWVALIPATICSCVCFWRAKTIKDSYGADFKENIVKAELSKVFDNLQYEPKGKFNSASMRGMDFFKRADLISGNDLITADYKGLRFAQCDLHVQEERVVKGKNEREETHWINVFRGRAMRFDFADKFRGKVQVIKRNFDGAKVSARRGNWQPVETEFAAFNDHFEVFALDPIDAMAVLTPQVIEGIFYMDRALGIPLAFYFADNSLMAFFPLSRDAFDASGRRTLLEEKELLQQDINLVTGFLDTMYFKRRETAESPVYETPAASMPLPDTDEFRHR